MIPYGRQEITDQDIAEVKKVLRSDYITQGQTVPKFEQAVAKYCGTSYAVAVNSATSALHISCLALDLGPGDYLWTSPNTFVASANCGRYCGADIDFVDIDPKTYCIDISKIEEKITDKTKVIIPVHLYGQCSDMDGVNDIANKHKLKVIEDSSQAHGATFKGQKAGSMGDIGCFSFYSTTCLI